MSRVTCATLADPKQLWASPICLANVSKDVQGRLYLLDREVQPCDEQNCLTLKTEHALKVEVVSHERCDSEVARRLDGVFLVRDLVTAFTDGSGMNRGVHAGAFMWRGDGLVVNGTLSGVTNAGTHRAPAFKECQECYAPGVMEGQLCGTIVRAEERPLVGCLVKAAYRFRFDPSEGGQDSDLEGTIEGLIVCPCRAGGCFEPSQFPPDVHPTPWTIGGYTIRVYDHTGMPLPEAHVRTRNGFTGMEAERQAYIQLPGPAASVTITLVHTATAPTVTALDSSGAKIAVVPVTAGPGTPQTLSIPGPDIAALLVESPSDEVLILEICPG